MTLNPGDLLLYCGALVILFLTPGPVWLALIARGLSGGFHAAWPLAFGVAIGDIVVASGRRAGDFVDTVRFRQLHDCSSSGSLAEFSLLMGWALIRHAGKRISSDSQIDAPWYVGRFPGRNCAYSGQSKGGHFLHGGVARVL